MKDAIIIALCLVVLFITHENWKLNTRPPATPSPVAKAATPTPIPWQNRLNDPPHRVGIDYTK